MSFMYRQNIDGQKNFFVELMRKLMMKSTIKFQFKRFFPRKMQRSDTDSFKNWLSPKLIVYFFFSLSTSVVKLKYWSSVLETWLLNLVLSCTLFLVFSRLKCRILVTQSPKYIRLKRIANQFSFVYTVVKSLNINPHL